MESVPIKTHATHIIGLAGESCSGKSAIANRLVEKLQDYSPVLLSCDHYYNDLSHIPISEREHNNFDNPEGIQWNLLLDHLIALKNGQAVWRPEYDFKLHTGTGESVRVSPSKLIIVEGLFVLYWEKVREILNTRVFVAVDRETAIRRRMQRDLLARGRTRESILRQIHDTVFPMADSYILPSRIHADIVIDGTDQVDFSADLIMRHVQTVNREKPAYDV